MYSDPSGPCMFVCIRPTMKQMWSDNSRGRLVDRLTQRWVRLTGRRVSRAAHPWLDGPFGSPTGIGAGFFERYAADHDLRVVRGRTTGLIHDFDKLRSATFDPDALSSPVRDFYARTSAYELDAWSEWSGPFRPFGRAVAALFSRRLQQLNVPLSNLDTSRGMTSQVLSVVEPLAGDPLWTAWIREQVATGRVIYAGAYSTCTVPDGHTPCVRVVFPLPNGNAIVLMRPTTHADGSLTLTSSGAGFGSPGFYFTARTPDGTTRARYLRTLRESIHVYAADETVRADHRLSLWGLTFLRLHYRLRQRHDAAVPADEQPERGASTPRCHCGV